MLTRKNKTIFIMFFSLLFAVTALALSFADTVWAEDSDEESEGELAHKTVELLLKSTSLEEETEGSGIHADRSTFEQNYELTPAQKEYTITECEKAIAEVIDPEMSDLEKYYKLAIWANQRVVYDWEFWSGGYNFDYYSHQWDSYGAMKEDEKSVCVGIAIFYSHLCHAADLPCTFARLQPEYLDHTISYIPDINGNAYYVDVTENAFLMSEESSASFEPYVDKNCDFAPIPKRCTDKTFDYYEADDPDWLQSTNIKDCYDLSFDNWFKEYALHKNTKKKFGAKYAEKGSGTRGVHYASYHDYPSNFVEQPDVWFLDDFYQNPEEIKAKILAKELDEDLLNISGIRKSYTCETPEELEAKVAEDISVAYFPSCKNGEIVAESDELTQGEDYNLIFNSYDDQTNTAEFTIEGIEGKYTGAYQLHVKMNSAVVTKEPDPKRGLVYNGSQKALTEPGEAENGTMQYAVGTKTEPTGEFTADIPSATNAGKYYIWYKAVGNEGYGDSEPQYVKRPAYIAPQKIKIIVQDVTIKVGESATLSPKLDVKKIPATFVFENFDTETVRLTEDGVVKGLKKGNASIFVDARMKYSTKNYEAPDAEFIMVNVVSKPAAKPIDISGAKITLSSTSYFYNGKVKKPSIKTIKGKKLKAGTDYTVKWSASSPKNVGTYKITVTGKGKYTGVAKATYKINPRGTSIKKLKRAKRAIKVKWKKQKKKMAKSRITGYQIQLATDKKFTKNKKTVTVKGYKKTSRKIKKLKGGKRYYVKVRTYKTVAGKRYYSGWSKVKTVKTKK